MSSDVPLEELLEKLKEAISKQSPGNSDKEQKQVKCPHSFGYLSKLPKGDPMPEECFLCSKLVECLASS